MSDVSRGAGVTGRGDEPDAGVTLVETLVAASLTAVFMAVFTGSVIQMQRSLTHQESASTAQSQINIAFQRLDVELRYASGIRVPGRTAAPGNIPYVEYRTDSVGAARCTQLRVFDKVLQMRTWDPETAAPPTAWRSLVSAVTPAVGPPVQPTPSGEAGPFAFWKADSTRVHQRLRLSLRSTAGTDWHRTGRDTAITFTALNTSAGTDSATVCPGPRPTY